MDSQVQMILHHLETHNGITPLEAQNKYGIQRLASRIHDIKDLGYLITDEYVVVLNRFGQKCRVKEYSLVRKH